MSHFVLDHGRLVVAHAGMREELAGRVSGRVRQFALHGDTTGETDSLGLPIRFPWAREYRGNASVVYGHTPVPSAEWINNTLCLDTACVFGGELTALRWPEKELVSVAAGEVYVEPVRAPEPVIPVSDQGLLHLEGLLDGAVVSTRFGRTIGIRPENAVSALEVLSRFAVDPRWLIHLPPHHVPLGDLVAAGRPGAPGRCPGVLPQEGGAPGGVPGEAHGFADHGHRVPR